MQNFNEIVQSAAGIYSIAKKPIFNMTAVSIINLKKIGHVWLSSHY